MYQLKGKIDTTNAQEFEKGLMAALPKEIDASELEYISCAGLRVLLKLAKAVGNVAVNNVSREVYEIFDVTGFTQILNVSRAIPEVSIEGCQLIGKGGNGSVYRINDETIFKVFNESKTLDYVKKSRKTAQTVFVHDIPCAISYDTVKVGNCYGVVYDLLNVKTLGRTIHSEPEKAEYWAEKAARLLRKLHSTEFADGIFGQASESVKGWVKTVEDKISADDAEFIKNAVDKIAIKRNTFVHEDFHSNNIMVKGNELRNC